MLMLKHMFVTSPWTPVNAAYVDVEAYVCVMYVYGVKAAKL